MSDDKLRKAVEHFILELEGRIEDVEEMVEQARKEKLKDSHSFRLGMLTELRNTHSRLSTLLEK